MSIKTHESFEEWFDIFREEVHRLGYRGRIDSDTFKELWEDGKDPYDEADEFVTEINL